MCALCLLENIEELELQEGEVILKAPLEVGESWLSGERQREIVAVDKRISTIAGKIHDVIKIRVENINTEDEFITHEYYAKNIGLIKRVSTFGEEEYDITAELQGFAAGNMDYLY